LEKEVDYSRFPQLSFNRDQHQNQWTPELLAESGKFPEILYSFFELLQKEKNGKTPDLMRISLDQAERLMLSSSDIKVHYSFLRLRF
jgi:hypothetical protein